MKNHLFGLFALCASASFTTAAVPLKIVALTGTAAPTISGATIMGFSDAAIAQDGQIQFSADLGGNITSANDGAAYSGKPGALAVLVRKGKSAPGLSGVTLNDLGEFPAGNGGLTAFLNWTFIPGGQDQTYGSAWLAGPGALTLLGHNGGTAADSGTTFVGDAFASSAINNNLVLNSTGAVAFAAGLGSNTTTDTNNIGLFLTGTDKALHLITKSGATVSNLGSIMTGNGDPFPALRINASGNALVTTILNRSNVAYNALLLAQPSGTFSSVLIRGDAAPGVSAFFRVPTTGGDFNDDNQIITGATLQDQNGQSVVPTGGIWAGAAGSLQLLALNGNAAPGTTDHWGTIEFSPVALSNGGYYAFEAGLDVNNASSGTKAGIWIGKLGGTGPTLVALEDAVAPGADNATFHTLKSGYAPAVNASGDVYFFGNLSTGKDGIWKSDAVGNVELVALEGKAITFPGGPTKTPQTVRNVNFGGGGHDGRPAVLNDAGQLVFTIQNTDSTNALVVAGTAPAVTRGVDAQVAIGVNATSDFVGAGIINKTGSKQIVTLPRPRNTTASYTIRIENTGSAAATFHVHGSKTSPGFGVTYSDEADADITKAVTKGTYTTANLDPGASTTIALDVDVKSKAPIKKAKTCIVTVKTVTKPVKEDVVKAKVVVVKTQP